MLRSRTGWEVARPSSFTFFYLFSGFSFLAQYILFADVCSRLFFCLDVLLHLFISWTRTFDFWIMHGYF